MNIEETLKAEEVAELEKWLEADEKNKLYFDTFKEDFLAMRWGLRARLISGSFERLQKTIQRNNRFRRLRYIAAAIFLLLAVGGGGWLFYRPVSAPVPLAVTHSPILPGKPQAVLVLSSGEQILLDSLHREVKEQQGITIQVAEGGVLNYQSTGETPETGHLLNQVIIPRGGEYKLQLADGTKVWLNAATEFRYPVVFTGKQREVYLKGEAYFEVEKDSLHPFIVVADDVRVKVYGTSFNVNNYTEEVQTVLVEGAVGMQQQGQEVRLKPGQKGECKGRNINVSEVDPYAYIAWKEGNFIFENEPLAEVMDKLARWYDVEVFYTREASRKIRLSGDMKRYKDIQSLLYYFEQISEVRFEVKGRTIVVK